MQTNVTKLRLRNSVTYEPAHRDRPSGSERGWVTFAAAGEPPSVFVSPDAIRTIVAAVRRAAPNETIGFLAGRAFHDEHGGWVWVEKAGMCRHARQTRTYVETTPRDEADLDDWMQGGAFGRDRLGWIHSHYELGVPAYSHTDVENQKLWCGKSWQVGLLVLVDDGHLRIRCYRGPDSTPLAPIYRYRGAAGPLPTRAVAPTRLPATRKSTPQTFIPWPVQPAPRTTRLVKRTLGAVKSIAAGGLRISVGCVRRLCRAAQAAVWAGVATLITSSDEGATSQRSAIAQDIPKLSNQEEPYHGDDV